MDFSETITEAQKLGSRLRDSSEEAEYSLVSEPSLEPCDMALGLDWLGCQLE